MLDQEFAHRFAREWIEAWNRHDLERVLAHYTEDFTMSSPLIAKVAGEASGRLRGKARVRAYWEKALAGIPDLRFELLEVFTGADSVTLYYRNQAGRLAAEVLRFDLSTGDERAVEGIAHYAAPPAP
ncbi:MAG: nuclear transport factor 2 family protein [Fimbriimonas sp.]